MFIFTDYSTHLFLEQKNVFDNTVNSWKKLADNIIRRETAMTQDFNYEEELSKCKTMQDITGQDGLVQKIIKDAVEHVLGMEMEDFILQEKEKGSSVTRNGTTHKNIKTAYGNIGIQVPRTRELNLTHNYNIYFR